MTYSGLFAYVLTSSFLAEDPLHRCNKKLIFDVLNPASRKCYKNSCKTGPPFKNAPFLSFLSIANQLDKVSLGYITYLQHHITGMMI